MSTSFATPRNNASSVVGPAGYTAGSGALPLRAGDGTRFGPLSAGQWLRVTVLRLAAAYLPGASPSDYTIYAATGVAGDTLTGLSTIEGTADRSYSPGDVVEVRVTGGTIGDLQGAVGVLEALEATTVYITGSYADPAWLTALAGSKVAVPLTGTMPVDTGGTTVLRWDSPDAGVGSWRVLAGEQTFAGVRDPMFMAAYNMQLDSGSPIVAGEPAWGLGIEAHACYPAEPGKHYCEFYLHYFAAGSSVAVRPIFLRIDRNAANPLDAVQDFNLAASTITLCHPDGTICLTAQKSAVTAAAPLVIAAGAIFQAGASQVVTSFSGTGNTSWSVGPNSSAVSQLNYGVGAVTPTLGGLILTYSNGDVILSSSNYGNLCWFHGAAGNLSIPGGFQGGGSGLTALSASALATGTVPAARLPATGLTITQHAGTITTDTDGSTITFDLSVSDWHQVTLGGNRTLALSNSTVGQQFSVVLQQDATGNRTVTWFGGVLWPGGTAPTLTATAGKRDVFTFKMIDSTPTYLGFAAGQAL